MNVQGPQPPTSSIQQWLDAAARASAARSGGSKPEGAEKAAPAAAAEAPSESSLWQILTPEERDFFESQAAMGPLTYRPASPRASQSAAPTGQRIDVKG